MLQMLLCIQAATLLSRAGFRYRSSNWRASCGLGFRRSLRDLPERPFKSRSRRVDKLPCCLGPRHWAVKDDRNEGIQYVSGEHSKLPERNFLPFIIKK
ncbi:hypothetical protein BDV59DRAFT_189242 [Aspergillus ambiguus]|uniref:uncharacterized protein n=1 Tax=Aspergillus ambiguus TaxID=176160 RepID=UPI003CCC961F